MQPNPKHLFFQGLVLLLLVVLMQFVLASLMVLGQSSGANLNRITQVAEDPGLVSLSLWFGCLAALFLMVRVNPTHPLSPRPEDRRLALLWLPVVVALFLCFHFTLGAPHLPKHLGQGLNIRSLLFLSSAILAGPILEEILFRDLLFRWPQTRFGTGFAIFITALFWALLHGTYGQHDKILIFLIGLIFGWARGQGKGPLLPILMHILWNLMVTIQIWVQSRG